MTILPQFDDWWQQQMKAEEERLRRMMELPRWCIDCNGTGVEQIPCDPDETECEFCGGSGEAK